MKHNYVYNLELLPVGKERKFFFDKGNYFHELAHVLYNNYKAGVEPGSDFARAQILARIKNDVSRLEIPRDSHLIPVYAVISRAMVRYITEQSPKIDAGIMVMEVEHELEHEISETLALFGYCDLIYRDSQGRLRLRDHKTGDRAWTKADARHSYQLLFYAVILWMLTGEVAVAEISYINTKDQKSPITYDKAFTFSTVAYTERELEIAYKTICKQIAKMLESEPIPYYASHCGYCAYETPCMLERKGIDSSNVISHSFVHVTRDSKRKHPSFSESTSHDSNDTSTN